MEAEAFPIRFTKGIRSYWRRRHYPRVDSSSGAGAAGRGGRRQHGLARLGDGSGTRPWAARMIGGMFRARRVRARAPAPVPEPFRAAATVARAPMRVLGRIRDAYVDAMLGAARKLPSSPDPLWPKRVPVRRSSSQQQARRQKPDEVGQRVVMEIYKSVLASRDLSGMLRASEAR